MATAFFLYFGVYDVGELFCVSLVEDAGNYDTKSEKDDRVSSCEQDIIQILALCTLAVFLVYFPLKIHLGLTLFSYTYERFKLRLDVVDQYIETNQQGTPA